MKKYLKTAGIAAVLALLMSIAALADGWTMENGQWTFIENGGKVVYDWRKDTNGTYYYLGKDGYMVTNSFIDNERFVDGEGKMVTNSWVKANNKWYYFDGSGKMVRDAKRQINGTYFFFDYDGVMLEGWTYDEYGYNYYCDPTDGHMVSSTWRYLEPADYMTQEYSDAAADGKYWFYFQANGKAVCATEDSYKEQIINGNRYAFDSYGRMVTGWIKLAETDPEIAGYKYYNDSASLGTYGAAHTGWLSAYAPEGAEHDTGEVQWYYFDAKGTPYYGTEANPTNGTEEALVAKLKKIQNGSGATRSYLFDQYGNPVYGLRLVQRSDGTMTSMYFGTKSQSCLQLGETSIEEADGAVGTYYFDSKGYGYNGVKKVGTSYRLYYMGKLQKATEGSMGYIDLEGSVYLVNTGGGILKNYNSRKDPMDVEYRSDSEGLRDGGTGPVEPAEAPVFHSSEY